MKDYAKNLAVVIALLVGLLAVNTAEAATSTDYYIDDIKLNDIYIWGSDPISVDRGDMLNLDVLINGTGDVDDVRVRAWIGGYEHGSIEAVTEPFDVEDGVIYSKSLKLELPEDLDADEYTLYVRVYDRLNEREEFFTILVKEVRHSLSIMDVILRPSTDVDAGEVLFADVRIENMGAKKEEDIKVTVSIPGLGVSARTYIDELAAEEIDNEDEETSMSTGDLYLRIPENTKTGDYEVVVSVEYDRGYKVVESRETIHVNGVEPTPEAAENVMVNFETSKQLGQGSEVGYKVMIANLGNRAQVYTVEVAGEKLWATSRVDPGFITVQPDSTGEAYVYVKAKDDAQVGLHTFTAKVLSGTTIVAEKNLSAEVGAKAFTQSSFSSKKALIIGFGVLVVIIVIIGLIIAFNRMKDEDEPGEIPTSSNGQAYY